MIINLFDDQLHPGSVVVQGRGVVVVVVVVIGRTTGRTTHVVDDEESYDVIVAAAAAVLHVIIVVVVIRHARSRVIIHLPNQIIMSGPIRMCHYCCRASFVEQFADKSAADL